MFSVAARSTFFLGGILKTLEPNVYEDGAVVKYFKLCEILVCRGKCFA